MDSYRFNQIAMAVLAALLLFFGTRTIIGIINEKPEAPEQAAPPPQQAAAAQTPDIDTLLQTASAAKGKQDVAICKACHNLDKGGPNMIGPNLYGVVDRPVGKHPGYDYSAQVKNHGGTWTYEALNKWLTNPGQDIPGTKMSIFPGIPDAKKRADIIAYLRTQNDNPPPLPKPKAAPAAPAPGGAAPAASASASSTPGILQLLPKASVEKGKQDVSICKMCHNLDKGGPNMIGPNLYGVVDRPVGKHPGYDYSAPVKNHGGTWTFEALNKWLTNPGQDIPGTKMSIFPGIPDANKRADIIAYLDTLNDNPPPLPGASGGGGSAAKTAPAAPSTPPASTPAAAPPATPPSSSGASPMQQSSPPASSGGASPMQQSSPPASSGGASPMQQSSPPASQ
jgi:cytochrome c